MMGFFEDAKNYFEMQTEDFFLEGKEFHGSYDARTDGPNGCSGGTFDTGNKNEKIHGIGSNICLQQMYVVIVYSIRQEKYGIKKKI